MNTTEYKLHLVHCIIDCLSIEKPKSSGTDGAMAQAACGGAQSSHRSTVCVFPPPVTVQYLYLLNFVSSIIAVTVSKPRFQVAITWYSQWPHYRTGSQQKESPATSYL